MGDTVRLRPNHYETLGLTPAASAQEIAQAFAKQLTLLPVAAVRMAGPGQRRS